MKKLNLKMKGIGEMLSKEQMKNVVGGDYGEPPIKCPQHESPWDCGQGPYIVICLGFNPNPGVCVPLG